MAAHVFDASEPGLDLLRDRSIGSQGPSAPSATTDSPMFAAQPAVFHKLQQRQRVGAGPLIGLAVGAVIVGGLVFAMSRHQGANGGAHHAVSQPSAQSAAATPAPAPAAVQANPAPVKAAPARRLRIETAPPPERTARVARVAARPIRAHRAEAVEAPAPAPAAAPQAVTPPAPLALTPAPAPTAPTPSLSTPAPQPAPATAPAPTPAPAPDASASSGQTTPQ